MRMLASIALSFAAAIFAAVLLPWSGWTWWAAAAAGALGLLAVFLRRHLPEKLRLPIHLYYAEGYSTEEIAGLLDIPAATVRTRLRRARRQLHDSLGGNDHEEERLSEFDGAYPAPRRAE